MMTLLEMEEQAEIEQEKEYYKEQTADKWNALMKAIKRYNESVKTDNDDDPFDIIYEVIDAKENYESVSFDKISFIGDKNIVSDDFHPIKSMKIRTHNLEEVVFEDIDTYLKNIDDYLKVKANN